VAVTPQYTVASSGCMNKSCSEKEGEKNCSSGITFFEVHPPFCVLQPHFSERVNQVNISTKDIDSISVEMFELNMERDQYSVYTSTKRLVMLQITINATNGQVFNIAYSGKSTRDKTTSNR